MKYLCRAPAPGLSSNWTKSTKRASREELLGAQWWIDDDDADGGGIGEEEEDKKEDEDGWTVDLFGGHIWLGRAGQKMTVEKKMNILAAIARRRNWTARWITGGKNKGRGAKSSRSPIIFSGLIRWEADLGPCGFRSHNITTLKNKPQFTKEILWLLEFLKIPKMPPFPCSLLQVFCGMTKCKINFLTILGNSANYVSNMLDSRIH